MSAAEPNVDASLADVLQECASSISAPLVGPEHRAGLTDACRRLPIEFSAFWGIETALGHERGEVDLLIELKRGSPRHALLAGSAPSQLDTLCEQANRWTELRRFGRRWADQADPRAALVRNVWVEFDLIAAASADPPFDALDRPSVFWGPAAIGGGDWPAFLSFAEFVREGFAPFPQLLPVASLERAVRHLPEGARIFQVGAMQTRGDVMLRLCINHLSPSDATAWLEMQQWQGDAQALNAALTALAPLVRVMALDVDYTAAGIGPKIGIECYAEWTTLDVAQWEPLLAHISALGLCVQSKRDAVAAFPAKTDHSIREQWQRTEHGMLFPVVYRNIHHIKLSFIDHAFREAKAYLGITRPGVKRPGRVVPDGEPDEWLSA